MSKSLEIKPSLKEVIIKIQAIVDNPVARNNVLNKAAAQLKKILAIYPPPGIWNRYPGTRGDGRWYERGYGSRWMRKDGSTGGKNTSQQFDRSWKTERKDEFTANIFTEVTYAPFLIDPDQRVHWAQPHGWVSVDQTTNEFADEFEKIALEEIDKQIGEL